MRQVGEVCLNGVCILLVEDQSRHVRCLEGTSISQVIGSLEIQSEPTLPETLDCSQLFGMGVGGRAAGVKAVEAAQPAGHGLPPSEAPRAVHVQVESFTQV